ncbi:hypothetical protein MANES_10G077066v8 [Manihot esculenta]|uniref:Uncharacterized protein n=1 Tax=Manihot esculenta TaxID=3983 RepID=A0ACB7GYW6_MANES|nr:hypothetical protein MANES_10G077066v8 [Manihot esculenta]
MVLNEKELSFEKKRPRRHLPGSAAESEVRPPNMERLRERLWPPKVLFERAKVRPPNLKFGRRTCMSLGGTLGCRRSSTRPPIKGPRIGNGRVFSPFSSSGEFLSSLGRFHVFLHLLHVFMRSMVILKSFKA